MNPLLKWKTKRLIKFEKPNLPKKRVKFYITDPCSTLTYTTDDQIYFNSKILISNYFSVTLANFSTCRESEVSQQIFFNGIKECPSDFITLSLSPFVFIWLDLLAPPSFLDRATIRYFLRQLSPLMYERLIATCDCRLLFCYAVSGASERKPFTSVKRVKFVGCGSVVICIIVSVYCWWIFMRRGFVFGQWTGERKLGEIWIGKRGMLRIKHIKIFSKREKMGVLDFLVGTMRSSRSCCENT